MKLVPAMVVDTATGAVDGEVCIPDPRVNHEALVQQKAYAQRIHKHALHFSELNGNTIKKDLGRLSRAVAWLSNMLARALIRHLP